VLQAPGALEKISELDLQTVLQSIQAISRELVLPNLITRLIKIIMANTGAQKVALLSRRVKSIMQQGSPTLGPDEAPAASELAAAARPPATPATPNEALDEWQIHASLESDSHTIYLDDAYLLVGRDASPGPAPGRPLCRRPQPARARRPAAQRLASLCCRLVLGTCSCRTTRAAF